MHRLRHALPPARAVALAAAVCALAGGVVATSGAHPAQAAPGAGAAAPAARFASLRAAFDNTAIRQAGPSTAPGAGIDGTGGGLSAADLDRAGWSRGAEVTVNGTTYTRADVPPGAPDNAVAAGQTIALRGSGDALGFLVAGADGPVSGAGSVTYTDGTSAPYTLTVDDWAGPADESTAVALPHRLDAAGRRTGAGRLSAVTVPLDRTRTLASVTLPSGAPSGARPAGPSLHVFDLAVRDTATAPNGEFWTGSWSAAYSVRAPIHQTPADWTRQTLRMVVHPTATGGTTRLRFTNVFNTEAVTLGHVTVATQSSGAVPTQTPVSVTFGGARSTTLAAGADLFSDPVAFPVTADHDLLVSVYLPGPVTFAPEHPAAWTTSYTSSRLGGDHTADTTDASLQGTFSFWTLLSGVDVTTPTDIGTTVAFGDSQTDCAHSTKGKDHRWPDEYARDVNAHGQVTGVVNAGISGNRLLLDTDNNGPSGVHRLDRDVFGQTNVSTLVLYDGINDIALSGASAAAVEQGLGDIATRARQQGIRVVMATIPPFEGYPSYSDAKDTVRQQVNAYIRTTSDADAYTDFDLATRDLDMPDRLLPTYYAPDDDHLHFNDNGTKRIAATLAAGRNGPSLTMSQTAGADFDGDGLADLIARQDADGTLRMWLGRKEGGFALPFTVTPGWRPFSQTVAADFTGDKKADIIARDGAANLKLWVGRGNGTFDKPVQLTGGWNFTQTTAADFDGNGHPDLIARDSAGNLDIWAGNGQGGFAKPYQLTPGWAFTQTAAADFTKDHAADIVARDSAGNLKMWTHNPKGTFNLPQQTTGGWNFAQTTAADFDGDGNGDLIARDNATGVLYFWRGRGDTTFEGRVRLTGGW